MRNGWLAGLMDILFPPNTSTDVIGEVNRTLMTAAHHREMLEACHHTLVALHGYELGTDDADDLAQVVYSGEAYPSAIRRIMHRRKPRHQGD